MGKRSSVCIPGSFDPPTIGHIELIRRASRLFCEVTVLISPNAQKNALFTVEERTELLTDALSGFSNVTLGTLDGLLAGEVAARGFTAVVKGVRNPIDFAYEYELYEINRAIGSANFNLPVETVMIPARKEYLNISSTMVRELIRYNADYSQFVPNAGLLRKLLDRK